MEWHTTTTSEYWSNIKIGDRHYMISPDAVLYFKESPQTDSRGVLVQDTQGRSLGKQTEIFLKGGEVIKVNQPLNEVKKAFGFGKEE